MCNTIDVLSHNNWVTPKYHRIVPNAEIEDIYSKYIVSFHLFLLQNYLVLYLYVLYVYHVYILIKLSFFIF